VTSTVTALLTWYGKTQSPVNAPSGCSKTGSSPPVTTYPRSLFSGTSRASVTLMATAMLTSSGRTQPPASVPSGCSKTGSSPPVTTYPRSLFSGTSRITNNVYSQNMSLTGALPGIANASHCVDLQRFSQTLHDAADDQCSLIRLFGSRDGPG
jgi:hypothetical protein